MRAIPFRVITNTTQRSRHSIHEKLSTLGLSVDEDEIFSAPMAAVAYVRGRAKERGCEPSCFLLSKGDVYEDFEQAGIALTDDASFVVVGDAGENMTYERLNHAFRLLIEDAELVAMEKDRYWMGREGLMLSAGPFVRALEYAADVDSVVGKPSAQFFMRALDDMGLTPTEVVMVGDDVYTDVGGAQKLGMRTVLVGTGKFRREVLERSPVNPDLSLSSIAHLPDQYAIEGCLLCWKGKQAYCLKFTTANYK